MVPHRPLFSRIALIAVLTALPAGCGWNTRQPPTTRISAASVAPGPDIAVRDDLTAGKIIFTGPAILRPDAPGAGRDGWRLRSEADKDSGRIVHKLDLRVHWTGSGVDYWRKAWGRVGREDRQTDLAMEAAELSVGTCARVLWIGCDHDEQITAVLPDGLLEQMAEHGGTVGVAMNHGRTYQAALRPDQARAHADFIAAWVRRNGLRR